MKPKGIVLSGPDKLIQAKAKQFKLPVTVDPDLPLPYDKTLFTCPGTGVPWDLLPAAWHFLERWDAAVPLWRYGVNASAVGSKEERKQTQTLTRDLRVLLHSVELLFVRNNEDGRALMDAYREELGLAPHPASPQGGEVNGRLAFLRAYSRAKPRLCVLPRTWLAEIQQKKYVPPRAAPKTRAPQLVHVEVAPGQFVRCKPENVQKVKAQFAKLRSRRRGGRRGR